MSLSPSQRVAIVTGAAQGIGQSVAIRLAQDGHDVAISDLPSKTTSLEDVAVEIRRLGRSAVVLVADVSIESQVQNLVSQTVKKLGGLDVMVANAGQMSLIPLLDTTVEEFERLFRINVLSIMLCYRIAAKVMIEQGRGGRLIGASSMAGKKSGAFYGTYSATKFAIRGLTQAAACELGPFGITVNTYAPGGINTPLMTTTDSYASDMLKLEKGSYMARIVQQTALQRLGEPVDIANVVSFLASKDSAYITGQSLSIDGGIYFD